MKFKTATMFFIVVLTSLGGLAQRPHKILGDQPGKSTSIHSSYNPAGHLQTAEDKISLFKSAGWGESRSLLNNAKNRLKAEPMSALLTEKLDSILEYIYDTVSMTYQLTGAQYYLFDTKGRNYTYWNSYFNEQFQAMVPELKFQVRYSSTDLITEEIYYQWYDVTQSWDPFNRYTYSYDANGNPTEVLQYYFTGDSTKWSANAREIYYYDDKGRDTSIIMSYWEGMWWDNSKTVKTYDAGGNLTQEADLYWNGEGWDGNMKYDYTYDGNNQQTQSVEYMWDWFMGNWYINGKYDYTWDGNGNVIEEAYSVYDTVTKVYTPDWKDLYEYDLSRELTDIALPYWWWSETGAENSGLPSKNKITVVTELFWNWATGGYYTDLVDTVYYSSLYDSPVNEASCKANFRSLPDLNNDQLIYFYDMSDTAVISWYWMFGDGETSTRRNPKHLYPNPGTYKVILTTVDESGFCSNTVVQQIKVGKPACNASFVFLVDTLSQQVIMTNQSEGVNLRYFWDFGDGYVSKSPDPYHTYDYPGSYQVTLTISNDVGTCTDRYTATVRAASFECNADFAVFVDSTTSTAYLRAKQVIPGNQYQWMLGDGSIGKTANYIHTFKSPGFYTLALTVSNEKAGCVESRKETLLVGKKSPTGKAGFIYLATDENKIEFTNQSLGTDLKYVWDFNDGETSTETNPVHPFVLPGYYTVCLTAFNSIDGSQDTYCEKIFAGSDTEDRCLARFEYFISNNGLRIDCKDRSFGKPDMWLWTYDGESPDNVKDPTWYSDAPAYVRVRETIMNMSTGCRDDAYALVNMDEEARLKAGFSYEPDTSDKKADTYPVDFVGVSLGDAGKLKWSFGDGTYDSTTVNPTHVYQAPGIYTACLTITNTSTGESDTECQEVRIGWAVFREELNHVQGGLRAYPNPFSESTRIEVQLTETTDFNLSLFDLTGRKIRTIASEQRPAGSHAFSLDGSELEGGSYYLILETGSGREKQLISIVK